MSPLELGTFAEKVGAVERHLRRVAEKLPPNPEAFTPMSDASDAVILHLWQAVQIVIDIAVSACVQLNLTTPATYADAFRTLASAGYLTPDLARRLIGATGLRNRLAHAYESLDMQKIFAAAVSEPRDLRAFLTIVRDRVLVDKA